jgi:hypothetical protein
LVILKKEVGGNFFLKDLFFLKYNVSQHDYKGDRHAASVHPCVSSDMLVVDIMSTLAGNSTIVKVAIEIETDAIDPTHDYCRARTIIGPLTISW